MENRTNNKKKRHVRLVNTRQDALPRIAADPVPCNCETSDTCSIVDFGSGCGEIDSCGVDYT